MTVMQKVKWVFGLRSKDEGQLTGTCQNCGRQIFSPDKGDLWLHRSAYDSENCSRPQLRVSGENEAVKPDK